MNDRRYCVFSWFLLIAIFFSGMGGIAQNKSKNPPHPKPQQTHQKSKEPQPKPVENKTVIKFTPEELESFRQQSIQLVKFFEGSLNFLADKSNPVKERQIIITQSYQKYFWDSKVQVEDDLDENRKVTLYKDIPAYLTDVDFFFRSAKFTYEVQDVAVLTNDAGQTYFKVTANRNLKGITVNSDSVNSNKVRYFEINYDDQKQQLRIVSIYTTKLNEKEDVRNWWNSLSEGWKNIFGKNINVSDTLSLASLQDFNDSVATVNMQKIKIDGGRVYGLLIRIIGMKSLDISGNTAVSNLEPVSKLSSLTEVRMANTPVSDLMPLRNLNALEILDCSGTSVSTLDPIRYAARIRELYLGKTPIRSIAIVASFPLLEVLDINHTAVDSLEPLKELTALKDLQCQNSRIASLQALTGKESLELLNFSGTTVTNVDPLKGCRNLRLVFLNDTKVSALNAFGDLTNLTRIYCDNTSIGRDQALEFMQKHPSTLVIFESEELTKWWNAMSPEWKKVLNMYKDMNNPPTSEQLHGLLAIDSVNVNGRMEITSLSPLEKLVHLRRLDCDNTSVAGFEPISGLVNLTMIHADNTKVTNVGPLAGLKKLKTLYINNTTVSDLTPLKSIPALETIFADNTGVTIQGAYDLTESNPVCLVIFQTYENTNWWKNLSQPWKDVFLSQLNLSGTPDKIQLQRIVSLEKVVITENPQIASLGNLLKLTRLKELQFSGTAVTSLEPVAQMKALKILRFPKNPVTDLTPLAQHQGLREIDCSNTPVEELEPIQFLSGLEVLKISGTQVKNLKYIQGMVNLKTLEAYNTRISNLDPLEKISSITSLKIFNTKISEKKVQKFKLAHPSCEVVYY